MTGKIGFWLIVLAAVAWISYCYVREEMRTQMSRIEMRRADGERRAIRVIENLKADKRIWRDKTLTLIFSGDIERIVADEEIAGLKSLEAIGKIGFRFRPWLAFIFLVALPSTVIGFLLILYQIVKRACR